MTRIVCVATLAVLVLGITSFGVVQPADASLLSVDIESGPLPRTDGKTVVWAGDGVHAMRMSDHQVITVAENDPNPDRPLGWAFADVDGDFVVWFQHGRGFPSLDPRLMAKNMATGEVFEIAAVEAVPRISGTAVIWESAGRIWARDIASMDPPWIAAVVAGYDDGLTLVESVEIDGDRVVWMESSYSDASGNAGWRYMTLQLGGDPTEIAHGRSLGGSPGGIDVAGDLAVYTAGEAVFAADIGTGYQRVIAHGELLGQPATDGRYVFWPDASLTNSYELRYDLLAYDLATDSSFAVVFNVGYNTGPDADGGALVWQRGFTDRSVHASTIDDIVPSARRPDPGQANPQWLFFSETGHYLWGMRPFWDTNGGPPVFGYPLTEEFRELNPDSGKVHDVQYFERQRFERHPENAGTPYEVLLGRLGAQQLVDQGRDWTMFAKSDLNASHYFTETGQAITEQFWGYWSNHGLELGDPGVSVRESVALFGFPISPAMVETNADGHTVLTQYFERAVFEHHPDNPDPFKVLLRRLGAEMLEQRGW